VPKLPRVHSPSGSRGTGAPNPLERKGLLRTWESEPERPVRGGRARRYFELTPAGNRALRQAAAMLGRMMSGLELLPSSGGR
jgi:DNA-binding PadR family transcriptional regulator